MSADITFRKQTRADYETLPPGSPRFQLIDGELHLSPSPDRSHQSLQGRLYLILANYLTENPIGVLFLAPFDLFLLETEVYQPDLLYVRADRKAIVEQHGVEGAPDLAIEIISRTSARYDRGPKRVAYLRAGTEELWLVDPAAKTIEVYRRKESPDHPTVVLRAGDHYACPLFPGLDLSFDEIFSSITD